MFGFISLAHAEPAAAPAASATSMIAQLVLPLAFFAIFYFFIIRPQSRRQKEHRQMID